MNKNIVLAAVAVVVLGGGAFVAPKLFDAKAPEMETAAMTTPEAAAGDMAATAPAAEGDAPAVEGAAPATEAAAEAPASPNDIAAVVDGQTIYRSEVMAALDGLPIKGQVDTAKIYPMIVDQMINEKLIAAKAEKSGIESDPMVTKKLDMLRGQLVRSVYLEREVSKLITEDKIKAEYDLMKKESQGKEEIRARHILVKTEEEAKDLIGKLDAGGDFNSLAMEKSIDPGKQEGGDLGYFTKEAMVPEFANAAFDLKPGSYSKAPVKTQFGWHVIKVEDKRAKTVPAFDEVKPALQNRLGQKTLETFIKDLRQAAKIERYGMDGKPLK